MIGLTGGIGSGKSEAARIMAELGAYVISADEIGKWVMDNNPGMSEWVRINFGSDFFDNEGKLIRKKLGDEIFSNPGSKQRLDEKIFPQIYARLKELIKDASEKRDIIVVDAAMIFEWGIEQDFDFTVTVLSSEKTVYDRLQRRDKFTRDQIIFRIKSQLPVYLKVSKANYVIHNDGELRDLRNEVEQFWKKAVENRPII